MEYSMFKGLNIHYVIKESLKLVLSIFWVLVHGEYLVSMFL